MDTNLNVLSFSPMGQNQLEQILEKSLKPNTESKLTSSVFQDAFEYHTIRYSGAVENVSIALGEFYDDNKKHLKNIRTLEKYLENEFAEDAELEQRLKDAKKQSQLWLAIHMEEFVQKEKQALIKKGISYATRQKMLELSEEMHRLETEIFEYTWTKEDFLFFMNASLETYPGQFPTMQRLLVHMVQHGAGFVLLKMEKEEHEKECSSINRKTDALQSKNERKIIKLTEDIRKQKEQIQSLQRKLSKKELGSEFIKHAQQKQAQIKIEYEKRLSVLDAGFNLERKELLREIAFLKEKNNSLNNQLNRYKEILQEEVQDEEQKEPLDLTKYNVIFMGGHPNQIHKLREKYPSWTYYTDESSTERLPKDADFLVYFTSNCSHTLFYQMQSWNKTRRKPIHYAYANNIEQFEQAVQEFIYKDDSILKHTLSIGINKG